MQFALGKFRCSVVSDGVWRVDGGTIFGVVPRVLWQKLVEPDEIGRIPLGLNSLVVRTPDALVLVETGIGTKMSRKAREFHDFGSGTLVPELARVHVEPPDVDIVILTHLHFDHCGGNTVLERGAIRPTFPNAKYVIQSSEWHDATHPDGLTRAGYDPDDFAVLEQSGQLHLVEGTEEIIRGVTCVHTGGHSRGHQMVLVESAGRVCCYPGDIMFTRWHVKPHYISAYDLNQAATYYTKLKLLEEACAHDWLMCWGHEIAPTISTLKREGDRIVAAPAEVSG